MSRRYSFKKVTSGEPAECYYCKKDTLFALFDKTDGSEVFCCLKCAYSISKGRCSGIKRYLRAQGLHSKKTIPDPNFLIKTQTNGYQTTLERVENG